MNIALSFSLTWYNAFLILSLFNIIPKRICEDRLSKSVIEILLLHLLLT